MRPLEQDTYITGTLSSTELVPRGAMTASRWRTKITILGNSASAASADDLHGPTHNKTTVQLLNRLKGGNVPISTGSLSVTTCSNTFKISVFTACKNHANVNFVCVFLNQWLLYPSSRPTLSNNKVILIRLYWFCYNPQLNGFLTL